MENIMKKILIGFLVLGSFSSFSSVSFTEEFLLTVSSSQNEESPESTYRLVGFTDGKSYTIDCGSVGFMNSFNGFSSRW